jgi:hypothetical protein
MDEKRPRAEAGGDRVAVPFRSPRGRGRWARRTLAVSVVLTVSDGLLAWPSSNLPGGVWTWFSVAFGALTAAAFLTWLHRARANLPALGIADARWSPGWAVGWWFGPGMNLIRPYQVIAEVWRASDPEAPAAGWRARPVSAVLGWWWALFLAPLWYGVPVSLLVVSRHGSAIPESDAFLPLALAGLLSAGLAIGIMREIDRRQEARARRLAPASP